MPHNNRRVRGDRNILDFRDLSGNIRKYMEHIGIYSYILLSKWCHIIVLGCEYSIGEPPTNAVTSTKCTFLNT